MTNSKDRGPHGFDRNNTSYGDPLKKIDLFDLAEDLMGLIESTRPVSGFQGHLPLRQELQLAESEYLDLIDSYAGYFYVDLKPLLFPLGAEAPLARDVTLNEIMSFLVDRWRQGGRSLSH